MTPDPNLPLFTWQPPACAFIAFPLDKQVGKVRKVARKLLTKTTDRHEDQYRGQVADALIRRFQKLGVSEIEQDEQIGRFWSAVELEVMRLSYRASQPGGTA